VLSHAAASLATYRPRDLPWRTAASLLLSAYGSLMAWRGRRSAPVQVSRSL
jgi:hypothetical protein